MKQQILKKIFVSLFILNQVYVNATADRLQNYFNKDAQRIINTKAIDGSKCLLVCSYLNTCKELATFPAHTSVVISNRTYKKIEDAMFGKWCIVLPESTDKKISPFALQKNLRFTLIPNKQQQNILFSKKRFARASRSRWDD